MIFSSRIRGESTVIGLVHHASPDMGSLLAKWVNTQPPECVIDGSLHCQVCVITLGINSFADIPRLRINNRIQSCVITSFVVNICSRFSTTRCSICGSCSSSSLRVDVRLASSDVGCIERGSSPNVSDI